MRLITSSIAAAALLVGPALVLATSGCKPEADLEAGSFSSGDYFCPMHPEVVRDEPGRCPRCGMDLVTGVGSTDYYCPMHPDVKQDVPGRCPDCGMALVRRGHESGHAR